LSALHEECGFIEYETIISQKKCLKDLKKELIKNTTECFEDKKNASNISQKY